jgi:hypothetical protein
LIDASSDHDVAAPLDFEPINIHPVLPDKVLQASISEDVVK